MTVINESDLEKEFLSVFKKGIFQVVMGKVLPAAGYFHFVEKYAN